LRGRDLCTDQIKASKAGNVKGKRKKLGGETIEIEKLKVQQGTVKGRVAQNNERSKPRRAKITCRIPMDA